MAEDEKNPAAEATEAAAEPKRAKKPAGRSFQVKDGGPARVCLGASPRVSISAGGTYTTEDERLSRRLASHPSLQEV